MVYSSYTNSPYGQGSGGEDWSYIMEDPFLRERLMNGQLGTSTGPNAGSTGGSTGGFTNYSSGPVGSVMNLQNRAEADRQAMFDLTQGRAQELKSDPYTMAALNRLKMMTDGQDAPFTDSVQSGMISELSDMSAAAEGAQNQALQAGYTAGGGSIRDPSFQAAQRENMSARQAANQAAVRDVRSKAQLANFDARFGGAQALAANRGSQNALINQMLGKAADYYAASTYSQNLGQGLASGGSTQSHPALRQGGSTGFMQFTGGTGTGQTNPWQQQPQQPAQQPQQPQQPTQQQPTTYSPTAYYGAHGTAPSSYTTNYEYNTIASRYPNRTLGSFSGGTSTGGNADLLAGVSY